MAQAEGEGDRLQDYVTVGATFSPAGDVEVSANQMLKFGTFYRPEPIFENRRPDGSEAGRFTIVSDEGAALGGQGTAPAPLQYFLAAIAF